MVWNEKQIYYDGKAGKLRDVIPHSTPYFDERDIKAVSDVIKSGFVAPGTKTLEFEKNITEYLNIKGCFVTNSGTSALHLALIVLGVGKGDKVLLPSLVCYAVLDAVNYSGAEPVFADVEPDTYNISIDSIKKKLHNNPKAIIVPYLYGEAADIENIIDLGVPVIEDCSQALGGEVNWKKLGSFGDISTFSFYATKIIATGSGGAVASNSALLLEKIKDIGSNYYKSDYKVRFNYRMSDLQASLGISQLSKLDMFLERRKNIAKEYVGAFKSLNIISPLLKSDRTHIYYRFMVRVNNNRDEYIQHMLDRGVICSTPDFPLHRFAGLTDHEFPNTKNAYETTISIPIYPYLNDIEVKHIIDNFIDVYRLLTK